MLLLISNIINSKMDWHLIGDGRQCMLLLITTMINSNMDWHPIEDGRQYMLLMIINMINSGMIYYYYYYYLFRQHKCDITELNMNKVSNKDICA